jgi:hypothetical protein
MNCQGDLKTVQEIEKVICGWNETILIKDGANADPTQQYQIKTTTNYSRVYEVYVGWYVFIVRLYFDERENSAKGRFSVPDVNKHILFRAVHGLKELVDKMTPMNGEWKPLELNIILQKA